MTDESYPPRLRGPEALTIRALQAGGAFASALFLGAIVLEALGSDAAERAAILGVAAIIATPALSLIATAVESWTRSRPLAYLAVAVLAVLATATAIAVIVGR